MTKLDDTTRLLNLLGLAMRAGKIVSGEAMVLKALSNHKLFLVFAASDLGAATQKKIKDKSIYYHVPIHEALNTEQLTQAIGKPRKILGVSDAGFAKGMVKLM